MLLTKEQPIPGIYILKHLAELHQLVAQRGRQKITLNWGGKDQVSQTFGQTPHETLD